jgi:hypothetical protein
MGEQRPDHPAREYQLTNVAGAGRPAPAMRSDGRPAAATRAARSDGLRREFFVAPVSPPLPCNQEERQLWTRTFGRRPFMGRVTERSQRCILRGNPSTALWS